MSQIPDGKSVVLGLKHCQQILERLLKLKKEDPYLLKHGVFQNNFHDWQISDALVALTKAIKRYEREASRVRKCQHKKAKRK